MNSSSPPPAQPDREWAPGKLGAARNSEGILESSFSAATTWMEVMPTCNPALTALAPTGGLRRVCLPVVADTEPSLPAGQRAASSPALHLLCPPCTTPHGCHLPHWSLGLSVRAVWRLPTPPHSPRPELSTRKSYVSLLGTAFLPLPTQER